MSAQPKGPNPKSEPGIVKCIYRTFDFHWLSFLSPHFFIFFFSIFKWSHFIWFQSFNLIFHFVLFFFSVFSTLFALFVGFLGVRALQNKKKAETHFCYLCKCLRTPLRRHAHLAHKIVFFHFHFIVHFN